VKVQRTNELAERDRIRFKLDLERQKMLLGLEGVQREMEVKPLLQRRQRMKAENDPEAHATETWQKARDEEALIGPIRAGREALKNTIRFEKELSEHNIKREATMKIERAQALEEAQMKAGEENQRAVQASRRATEERTMKVGLPSVTRAGMVGMPPPAMKAHS